jgi:TonB family protein
MTASTGAHDLRPFRPLGRGTFVGGVFVTLLIHAGLAALVWYGTVKAPAVEPGEREVLITRMVTLGKPREKFWLPRIVQPPPPKPVEQVIKVADDPNAKPVEKDKKEEKQKPPEKPDLSKKVQEMLNRRRAMFQNAAEEPPEGDLHGDPNSNSSTTSEGDPYATAIYNAIREHWTVPTGLSLGDVLNFETAISVRIAEDGSLLEPKVRRSSGNALFDDSCLQAVQATRHVPPPPPAQRAKYRRGLTLAFDGKSLAR